jgi:hypothetical protein
MANRNLDGDKTANTKRSKKELSQAYRTLRIQQGRDINPAFCDGCGFRVRSSAEGHLAGAHHNGRVADCHR